MAESSRGANAPGGQLAARGRPRPAERLVLCCLLLIIVAVWGWTFTLMKDAIAKYGVVSFLAIRFLIASAALMPFAARRFDGRGLRVGGLIGLVLAASYLLQTFGLRHTTATNTGLITGLFIVFAPLANRALFAVRTSRASWGLIAVSVLGLGLLTGAAPGGPVLGDALTLGAAACFGLHVALLDRHAKRHPPIALAQGQILAAGGVFLLVWPIADPVGWPTPDVWLALLVTGVVATAAAFLVQTLVQRRLSAVQTAAIIVTEPVFAAAFGYLLAGDRLTGLQIAGACLMVAAFVTIELYTARGAADGTVEGGPPGGT
jgi:drug/metabolite transporter (DMT)-like permease